MPSATPIFTKRDPLTGAVLFDFSGHIHASGLDLDVSENNPDQTRSVQWIRTASAMICLRVLVDKDDGSGRVAAILLDSALRSSFVQTTSVRQLAISAGQNQMFFGGVNSATAAVTHGLGRTPISAVCIGVGFNFLGSIQAWDATSVTYGFQIVNPPGGTFGPGNMSFNWIAIG
jgi:hypothetical protein